MLITVDIGNTHISIGVFDNKKLIKEFRLATNRHATVDELGLVLAGLLRECNPGGKWAGVVMSSVVPELDSVMARAATNTFAVPVLTVTPEMKLPIKNGYTMPHNVGADRLVAAVAAVEEFKAPVIIVDFGTAITVDAVSDKKVYLGGAILPGLILSAEALSRGTSLLPRIEIKTPESPLGQDTEESIRSGVIFGAAGSVDYLVKKMKKEIGSQAKVVATGGLASIVVPLCSSLKHIRKHLTLDGLRLTWEYYSRRRRR